MQENDPWRNDKNGQSCLRTKFFRYLFRPYKTRIKGKKDVRGETFSQERYSIGGKTLYLRVIFFIFRENMTKKLGNRYLF